MISGETQLVGLLGDPVSQSLSPLMQNAAFASRGLDWAYVPLPVTSERLDDAVRGLVAFGFAGANVTTPHKLAVAKLIDADEPSVNTLVVRDGRVVGYSTDAAILAELEFRRAAILGDGGAAIAFAAALPDALRFSRRGTWPPEVSDVDLIVNSTSERDEVLVELGLEAEVESLEGLADRQPRFADSPSSSLSTIPASPAWRTLPDATSKPTNCSWPDAPLHAAGT